MNAEPCKLSAAFFKLCIPLSCCIPSPSRFSRSGLLRHVTCSSLQNADVYQSRQAHFGMPMYWTFNLLHLVVLAHQMRVLRSHLPSIHLTVDKAAQTPSRWPNVLQGYLLFMVQAVPRPGAGAFRGHHLCQDWRCKPRTDRPATPCLPPAGPAQVGGAHLCHF